MRLLIQSTLGGLKAWSPGMLLSLLWKLANQEIKGMNESEVAGGKLTWGVSLPVKVASVPEVSPSREARLEP